MQVPCRWERSRVSRSEFCVGGRQFPLNFLAKQNRRKEKGNTHVWVAFVLEVLGVLLLSSTSALGREPNSHFSRSCCIQREARTIVGQNWVREFTFNDKIFNGTEEGCGCWFRGKVSCWYEGDGGWRWSALLENGRKSAQTLLIQRCVVSGNFENSYQPHDCAISYYNYFWIEVNVARVQFILWSCYDSLELTFKKVHLLSVFTIHYARPSGPNFRLIFLFVVSYSIWTPPCIISSVHTRRMPSSAPSADPWFAKPLYVSYETHASES